MKHTFAVILACGLVSVLQATVPASTQLLGPPPQMSLVPCASITRPVYINTFAPIVPYVTQDLSDGYHAAPAQVVPTDADVVDEPKIVDVIGLRENPPPPLD